MALLQKMDYGQTKLLKKTTRDNSGPEKSRLIGKKDLEGIIEKIGLKQKAKRPEREVKEEIIEETRPELKPKREEEIE